MTKPEYLHWSEAGGPNECEHGYAEGIPCPNCDANPRIIELRAENERLREELNAKPTRVDFDDEIARLEERQNAFIDSIMLELAQALSLLPHYEH